MERKFAALPRYIEYRCNACKKVFSAIEISDTCPLCGAVLKEVGYRSHMDEIPIRRV
jgi:rRNA maturation endonuclease Nob1